MNLLELQRQMLEDVRRPLTPEFSMQAWSEEGRSIKEIAASYIKPNKLLSSFERLEIYNRQYWFRVLDAVSEDYPALRAVLGPQRFDQLIADYLKETPSVSWTLRDLSSSLPQFLQTHPSLAGRKLRLAVDVAKLEWAYVEAFDGRDLEPLTPAEIGTLTPDSKVCLQPHIRLLEVNYPVDDVVLGVHRLIPESDIVSNAAAERKQGTTAAIAAVSPERVWLAVHRYKDAVYYRRLSREAWRLWNALSKGRSIADSIGEAFYRSRLKVEQRASLVQEAFAHAAELGWLCPFHYTSLDDSVVRVSAPGDKL